MNRPDTHIPNRAALSDLVHRYAATVDDRQSDAAAKLFTVTADLADQSPGLNDQRHRVHSRHQRPCLQKTVALGSWPAAFSRALNSNFR
ncbi:hypothetical protein ABH36_16870 [Mycobacterium haemophilum]|nr:hypothetical protein ABH36_16870 [Mycobacterium haemophilum]